MSNPMEPKKREELESLGSLLHSLNTCNCQPGLSHQYESLSWIISEDIIFLGYADLPIGFLVMLDLMVTPLTQVILISLRDCLQDFWNVWKSLWMLLWRNHFNSRQNG